MSDYSDSDSDYNENEKILLNKYRNRQKESDDENEEAVFNVYSGDENDSDDNEDVLADSDIEGQEEDDDLPDEKAWGRNKKSFYSTDYVNHKSDKEKDIEFAEFEAEGAKKLVAELYGYFDSQDLSEQIEKGEEAEKDEAEEESTHAAVEEDLSTNLIDDFEEFTDIYENFLKPFQAKSKSSKISNSPLTDFVQCFSDLILNYSTNISMYFLLKAENTLTKNHPILKRLQQYQESIGKLHSLYEEKLKSKIEEYLNVKESIETETVKPKKLKILQNPVPEKSSNAKKRKLTDAPMEKIVEFTKKLKMEEENTKGEVEEDSQADELVKRPITYQIAKNKGLTPHRKKEQRNPRVKHRNKYKKAKIRRKGAVREVRNESSRYGGEMSGINAHVLKGIKLKV